MIAFIRPYLTTLAILLSIALVEKGVFAVHHNELRAGLTAWDVVWSIGWGIRFDLALGALLAFFAYLVAYFIHRVFRLPFATVLRYSGTLAVVLLVTVQGADLLYFQEAGRHLGYELKEWYNSGTELAAAALSTYTVPVAIQLVLMTISVLVLRWALPRADAGAAPGTGNPLGWLRPEASLIMVLIISVVAARGGLQSVPLEPLHAQEIGSPQRAALALNGAYNALFSSVTRYSIPREFSDPPNPQELAVVRDLYPAISAATAGSGAKQYNVVIVLLESWSAAYMGGYGYSEDTTPRFEELRREALTTRAMLAGGHRTTEGMFATFCSTQNPLGQTVAQSQLQNYDYDCLPELLRANGYHTAFFQGTLKNTSGTGAFAQSLGFEQSFGKKDVSRRRYELNSWGLHDPDLYGFALERMRQMPQPFLVGINTNSTHDSALPTGISPAFPGNDRLSRYLSALHFADAALGDFVAAVAKDKSLHDTIFVLVADHAGMTPASGYYRNLIPFMIYAPGKIAPRDSQDVVSQRDIAPTVLDVLGLPTPAWFTGQSLLSPNQIPRFADYYHAGQLGWLEGDQLVAFPLRNPEAAQCFDYADDPGMQRPQPCPPQAASMTTRALAFTHVAQYFLFEGRLRDFARLRAPGGGPIAGPDGEHAPAKSADRHVAGTGEERPVPVD